MQGTGQVYGSFGALAAGIGQTINGSPMSVFNAEPGAESIIMGIESDAAFLSNNITDDGIVEHIR